jgi:hypothetical protein
LVYSVEILQEANMLVRGLLLTAAMAVVVLLGVGSAREAPAAQTAGTNAAFIGDVDCDKDVDVIDVIYELRGVTGLPTPTAACLEASGDTDCDADRDGIDVLRLLRHIAGLEVTTSAGCLAIGQTEVHIPLPPTPFPLPAGAPDAQAAALAEAVAPDSPDSLAGWLAVYDALGVPVFGDDGSPLGTTGDDPLGPPFWRVWYMSVMSTPQSSIPLTTLVRGFGGEGDAAFDSTAAADALLADLRAAAGSDDPQVQLLGLLAAAVVGERLGGVDLLDPTVTADDVLVPGGLAELVSWVAIRGSMFAIVRDDVAATEGLLAQAAAEPAATPPCTREGGTDPEVAAWANWAIGVIAGGGQLPGMTEAVKGLVQHVDEAIGSGNLSAKVSKFAPTVNVVTSLMTLAMMLSALDIRGSMDPDPMVRTKAAASNGYTAALPYQLFMDPGKLPDDNGFGCLASYLLNVFGVSLGFPASGGVPGADIQFQGKEGFPNCPLCNDGYVFMDLTQFGARGRPVLSGG